MREILFRGKRADNGEWVYGSLITERNMFDGNLMTMHIQDIEEPYDDNLIDDETVGQFTGLTDKNGTKIFEGDIVKTKYGRLCEVRWFSSPCYQCWDLIPIEATQKAPDSYDVWASKNLEVVGNVHDGGAIAE